MVGYEELIGKKVVIKKNDGYVKFGILKSVDAQVLVLEYDGVDHYIPIISIGSVSLDGMVG